MENQTTFEPAHDIMVLFILRKLILQTRMPSHTVGLDVWFLVAPFVYFHTSCVRTAKVWRDCANAYVISTISLMSWLISSDFHVCIHGNYIN